jgi:hypothetical protein
VLPTELHSSTIGSLFKKAIDLGMVEHSCNSGTQKAEAGRSQVEGQLELHSKTLSKKTPAKQSH